MKENNTKPWAAAAGLARCCAAMGCLVVGEERDLERESILLSLSLIGVGLEFADNASAAASFHGILRSGL